MPIPNPQKGEKKSDFMSRCIGFVTDEGKKQDQAIAMCSTQWDNKYKSSKASIDVDLEDYETCLFDNKDWGEITEAAEYKGRKVTLNKPFRTPDGPKKFAVYVKNKKGNVIIVRFGDPNMKIKKNDPKRRKSFRARHKCSEKKDKTKPGYWACKAW